MSVEIENEVKQRFWNKVNKTNSCWLWTASKTRGYGIFNNQGTYVRAHRFSYELIKGPIPNGLHLDHLCRVRYCVNPDHLEPVTQKENTARGRRTYCKNGHELIDPNIIYRTVGIRVDRRCRICANNHYKDRNKKLKELGNKKMPLKKFCNQGHRLTKDNLIFRETGYSRCKQCKSIVDKIAYLKRTN